MMSIRSLLRCVRLEALEMSTPIEYRPDEPCGHRGCLSHVTHPCEGCGRIAGQYPSFTIKAEDFDCSAPTPDGEGR